MVRGARLAGFATVLLKRLVLTLAQWARALARTIDRRWVFITNAFSDKKLCCGSGANRIDQW
jgi:hypothetical protein